MNYPSLVWHLKRTELFADLELNELEKVAATTPYRSYQPGEVVYRMDDPADALYFVRSGLIKISKLFPNGKEAILSVVGQHDTFGELLLQPEERRPTQAEALERTTLIVLPRTELQRLLALKPDLAETKIYTDPAPWGASVGHAFSRRVDRTTLERVDSPAQIDSWNRTWTFFEWNLKPSEDRSKPAAPIRVQP